MIIGQRNEIFFYGYISEEGIGCKKKKYIVEINQQNNVLRTTYLQLNTQIVTTKIEHLDRHYVHEHWYTYIWHLVEYLRHSLRN